MVTCPKCGTANPRGSRFCNECGEPLPLRTALRCPMCGTMNPVTNVYCEKCRARLTPMAAPRSEESEREEARISEPLSATVPREEERERQGEDSTERLGEEKEEEVGPQDWLAQLRASAAEEAEEPETIDEPIEPVEIPDWLRGMGAIDAEAETEPSEEPPPAEVPLGVEEQAPTTRPPSATEEPIPTPPLVPADIPDWLQEMAPTEAVEPEPLPEESPSVTPSPALAEIPDWLREMAPLETAEPEPTLEEAPPTMPPPVAIEIPDWLREAAPPETAEEETPPAAEAALPPSPIVGVPPAPHVLKPPHEIAPEVEAPAGAPLEAAPSTQPPMELPAEAEISEIPDWLQEMAPPEAVEPEPSAEEALPTMPPPAPTAPAFEEAALSPPLQLEIGVAEAEELARAEIPDWLEALRPEAAAEREPVETEGPLEGLRGVLTPASAIKVPARRAGVPPSEISDASLARAQFLQSLLTQPAEAPQPKPPVRGIGMSERVQRWLVRAVLLVAVGSMLLTPLIIPREDIPALARPAESPMADRRVEFQRLMRVHDVIQDIHGGDIVLVALEYGPPEADELNLVAQPVLRHLLDQGTHVSVVSTRPEGQAVAAELLSGIVASEEQYADHYTLLPYRAGDAAGVSQLLIDAGAHPALIVVLTAQPGPLRWWVEQTRALYGDTLPVVAGISAALEPVASPYLDASARQLEGAINGLNGAAAYEALRGSAGQATQRLNALAVGHAAIVGLMILGAVFHTLSGLRGREK
jgi:hypothetical protein